MNLKNLPGRVYLVGFIIITVLAAVFYLLVGSEAKNSISDQILAKQQVLARAEASNITSFFHEFGNSVAVLAQLKSIESKNLNASDNMDSFVEQWRASGIVDGVALTDAKGIVQLNSDITGITDTGALLSDRDYFLWGKSGAKRGEYFIGQPVISRLGGSKNQLIVPVASPVYQDGKFTGVVVAAVVLKKLTQNYLTLMMVSDKTDVYLISQDGILLFSSTYPVGVGSNVFDLLEAKGFPGTDSLTAKLRATLEKPEEGQLRLPYKDPVSQKMEDHFVAYSPVSLGAQNWLLIMASPVTDIWNITVPMYLRVLILLLILTLTMFIFGFVAVKEVQKRGDQNKL